MKINYSDLSYLYRFLYPRFTIIVSCGTMEKPNALTIAWSSPLSANPPLFGFSITKQRYSYHLTKENKSFVINIPDYNTKNINAAFFIGRVSGKNNANKIVDGLIL